MGNNDSKRSGTWIDYVIVFYLIGFGVLYVALSLMDFGLFSPKPPRGYVLTAFSGLIGLMGIYFLFQLHRGALENKNAKTVLDIRKEAVSKLNDAAMLARIAETSPIEDVRGAARKRLAELRETG